MFLREQLNNFGIQVAAKINEVKESKNKVFTAQEKFDFLAKKNPALLKLKELLQLETSH